MATTGEQTALRRCPTRWPERPFLPLVRGDLDDIDSLDLGLIVEWRGNTVFEANLMTAHQILRIAGHRSDDFNTWLDGLPRTPYRTFRDVLRAGWMID